MLPAAVGGRDGSMSVLDGPLQMVTGGLTMSGFKKDAQSRKYRVPRVDLSAWMRASFVEADFVILKLDVEGAEHAIVPRMIADKTTRLVDVLLWECHSVGPHSKCHELRSQLVQAGVCPIYQDPYPWTPRAKRAKNKTWERC